MTHPHTRKAHALPLGLMLLDPRESSLFILSFPSFLPWGLLPATPIPHHPGSLVSHDTSQICRPELIPYSLEGTGNREALRHEGLVELGSSPDSSTSPDTVMGDHRDQLLISSKPSLVITADHKPLRAGMSLSGVCMVAAVHHPAQTGTWSASKHRLSL